ncbi:hypothetical protein [Mycobacterium asiaticum]|uniref:Uncharacterized protein n=1 Tax=Mycobacterium asiaticum TaxID=1790 RepID=A0A1A3NME2_MYCAS|nr:hypothetical protein [Mycobacterium asiaticum]OBK22520.1 hypothetical protein A5635_21630 [Mycobacterium asiaticum]
MDNPQVTAPNMRRRNYACIGGYVETFGPPTAHVSEDAFGPLIRTSPFGQQGLLMCLTIERWRQIEATVNKAISEYGETRLWKVAQ